MPRKETYTDVLNAAIADVLEKGYEPTNVAYWVERLRAAANLSAKPIPAMEEALRDAMVAVYRKLVDKGQIIDRYSFGVSRFTLENVKPSLRAELDRRIMASASLIRLRRQETIAKTLARFEGWSTSIPKGGSEAVKKSKVAKDLKKALAQERYEERRVTIDQSAKLVSNLNGILATNGGALAGRWRSHWRQPGYDYREDHKERDGKLYVVRDNWAIKQGLMKTGGPYTDEITQPAEEVYCRCYYIYQYSLGGLPREYLTKKGEAALAEARAKLKEKV